MPYGKSYNVKAGKAPSDNEPEGGMHYKVAEGTNYGKEYGGDMRSGGAKVRGAYHDGTAGANKKPRKYYGMGKKMSGLGWGGQADIAEMRRKPHS